jgi:hypothetical protein
LIVATVVVVGWLIRSFLVEVGREEWGAGVAPPSWLPAGAARVSFYESYNQTVYEFDLPEPEFVRWSSWELSEVVTPVRVRRWTEFVPGGPTAVGEPEARSVEIRDGLAYSNVARNGGGIWIAYDRQSNRAYFHSVRR